MGFRQDPNPLRVPPPPRLLPASGNITQPPRLRARRDQQAQERRRTVGLLGGWEADLGVLTAGQITLDSV